MDDMSLGYTLRTAATFRGILNDLKRNDEVAANELGVDAQLLKDILSAKRALPLDLIRRAAEIWPVNERDFFPIHDDVPHGVVIMHREESAGTSRVLQRGGRDYYEYRDSAMSRVAMIRPEWIKMLNVVEDNDPLNKTVQWNNGHFLYQFTYFIGDVNYYYEWNGAKFCEPMRTGDSVFGMPYAPHSFATRKGKSPGSILALTYGGRLCGDAQHELSVLGVDSMEKVALPSTDPERMRAAQIRRFIADMSLSVDHLVNLTGFKPERIQALLAGRTLGNVDDWRHLARVTGIPERELEPNAGDVTNGVRIVKATETQRWRLPDDSDPSYEVKRLAGSRIMPYSHSLEISALKGDPTDDVHTLETGLHQFGYVVGDAPLELEWEHHNTRHRRRLGPQDSFYIKPFVPHRYVKPPGVSANDDARILVLRVGGKVISDALIEASFIGAPALSRLISETSMWYDPKGKN
jgi:hypothetical protein